MLSYSTSIEDDLSHIELANVVFDQWNLTISLRLYSRQDQSVVGMASLIFRSVTGFRYFDEGDMLRYPFPDDCTRHYVNQIDVAGWLRQESDFGNIVPGDFMKEYLVATSNECICVISPNEPVLVRADLK